MARSTRQIERDAKKLERKASTLGSIPGIRSIFAKALDRQEQELEAEYEAAQEEELTKPNFFERQVDAVQQKFRETAMNLRARNPEAAFYRRYFERIKNPKFIEGKYSKVTSLGQWGTALTILVPLIIVSLALDTAAVQVISDVFLQDSIIPGDVLVIGQFLVTLIGLGIFIVTGWFWFLFVRTGGFGLFDL